MVSYGLGTRGDLVVDSDTTLDSQMLQFDDLFVTAGNTLTVPHRTVLMVRDSLEVNGTLRVAPSDNAATYSSGTDPAVNVAGPGGGSLNIIAFSVIGSGRIEAPGGDGDTTSADRNVDPKDGTPATVAHETVSTTPATADAGGSSLLADFDSVIENRLVARFRVSKIPWQHITAGSGSTGDSRQTCSGGGLGGRGGGPAGRGEGGGGAGGFVLVTTQNENESVTYAAPGGAGGGGGSNGGGGGIVVGYTDTDGFRHDVPGAGGGADGFAMALPLKNVL